VRRLTEGCAEAGDHVTVLTHQAMGAPVEKRVRGISVRRFLLIGRSQHYPFSMGLFRYLRSHAADFDRVHAHSYRTFVGQAAAGSPPWVFTQLGTDHTPPIVQTVGRLERYKNVDLVVDAFQALPRPATLVVVGDGPGRARLERHAAAAGPGWPIRFTGRISGPELGQLFAQASVVTSASDLEACGITLADWLASGARNVASAILAHVPLTRLVGPDAPTTLADPRDTAQFRDLFAASLCTGRIPDADLKLPSWADAIATTRELYAQVRWLGHQAYRKDT
jgi:glycosyltransferase involved in cell wall biosynthesis